VIIVSKHFLVVSDRQSAGMFKDKLAAACSNAEKARAQFIGAFLFQEIPNASPRRDIDDVDNCFYIEHCVCHHPGRICTEQHYRDKSWLLLGANSGKKFNPGKMTGNRHAD